MNATSPIVVLDLGSSKVAAIAARMSDAGRLEVLSLAYVQSRGISKGGVTDLEEAAKAIDDVLGKIERHLKFRVEDVWTNVPTFAMLSLTGQAVAPLYPSPRAIKRQDVHQVLTNSKKLLIPDDRETVWAVAREYIVDGQRHIHHPTGLQGSRLEVVTHVVTAVTEQIDVAEQAVSASRRTVAGMVPASLASGYATLSKDGRDLGAVIVDVGGGKTEVGVFIDGAYAYQAVVPIGGINVSRDIQQLLHTDFDEAERLKADYSSALPDTVSKTETVDVMQQGQIRPMQRYVLCQIVESRMREIFEHVGAQLEKSGLEGGLPKMAVLTGGGSILRGTEELFEKTLPQFKCKVAQPKVEGKFAGQVASPMLSTAVGIARYSLESEGEELAPVSGLSGWQDRIRSWISRF